MIKIQRQRKMRKGRSFWASLLTVMLIGMMVAPPEAAMADVVAAEEDSATVEHPKEKSAEEQPTEENGLDGETGEGDENIVRDTDAPEIVEGSVSYASDPADAGSTLHQVMEEDSTHYYLSGNAIFSFQIREGNFDPEDYTIHIQKRAVDGTVTEDAFQGDARNDRITWTEVNDTGESLKQYTGIIRLSEEGDYSISITSTDQTGNEMNTYISDRITIDKTAPVISVDYANNNPVHTLPDAENHNRQYFTDTQTATVTIQEHNFDPDEVHWSMQAKEVSGRELDVNSLSVMGDWADEGDLHTIKIIYPGDANYTFDVDYTDQAGNAAADRAPDYFTVDTTAPTNLTVSYSKAVQDVSENGVEHRYYQNPVTVTITATDRISGVHHLDYSYLKATGVNGELMNQRITGDDISYSEDGATATARFKIPREVLTASDQFNGNITFTAADRAENQSAVFSDNTRIVVDNIAPNANIAFNQPVQTIEGIAYFDGAITGIVTIAEANFHAEDIQIDITSSGSTYLADVSWKEQGAGIHVGTFFIEGDGDYIVTVRGTDKSGNRAGTYTSGQMTVDTQIEAPVLTVNGVNPNGLAYKEDVVAGISVSDTNFANYTMNLTRTRNYDRNIDVTQVFLKSGLTLNDAGGEGTFDTFRKERDVDGIYTLTVQMWDKAGHTSSSSATFSVNRYGSVYVYSDYLSSLIKNGGAYVKKVRDDLQITEYNPDQLVEGSLIIDLARDGKPVEHVSYSASPEVNRQAQTGESGWYQYTYTIARDNFKADGIYKLSISSRDSAGNSPETEDAPQGAIVFYVDTTPPEINSITGLEQKMIHAEQDQVKYTVFDNIGLKSVRVYVNDKKISEYTDFHQNPNQYEGNFSLKAGRNAQRIRLVVEDRAGNITDTEQPGFAKTKAYPFCNTVVISTNPILRTRALVGNNLLWIVFIAAAVVVVFILIRFLRNGGKRK